MSRVEAESLNKLDLYSLKQKGLLQHFSSGTITWKAISGEITKADFKISPSENAHLAISYIYKDLYTGDEVKMDYAIPLVKTPCRYGGVRYWFLCPIARDGIDCGRRTNVLYRYGKYFICRKCANLAYQSQNLSGKWKGRRRIVSVPELEALEGKVGYEYYRGKPTRKYRRYLEMSDRFMAAF